MQVEIEKIQGLLAAQKKYPHSVSARGPKGARLEVFEEGEEQMLVLVPGWAIHVHL